MNRSEFLSSGSAACAMLVATGALPSAAFAKFYAAESSSLDAVLGAMPAFTRNTWIQYSFETAPKYAKRIGFGLEHTSAGTFHTIETQIGGTATDCDPDTVRKVYLQAPLYGNLLQPHDVRYITLKAGTQFILARGTKQDRLWLLDTDSLYTRGSALVVGQSNERFDLHGATLATRRVSLKFRGSGPLRSMTLWLAPAVPGGIARMEASAGSDAFAMRLNAYGVGYHSLIAESFESLRAQLGEGTSPGAG